MKTCSLSSFLIVFFPFAFIRQDSVEKQDSRERDWGVTCAKHHLCWNSNPAISALGMCQHGTCSLTSLSPFQRSAKKQV